MRRFVLLIAVLALFALPAVANSTSDRQPLEFTRLDLTDGRTLKNVSVRSYDAKSDKLLLITDGKAMTIPLSLVPAAIQAQFRKAPESGATVSVAPAAPKSEAPSPSGTPASPARPTPPARDTGTRPDDPQTRERAIADAHRKVALEYAVRYFRYEYQVGPSNVRIDSVQFGDVTNRAVPGWVGTYETSGTAFLEFFDSSRLSYGRAKAHFDVRTEQKPNEEIKVVSFDKRA